MDDAEYIVGLWNFCRAKQKLNRDANGRPTVYAHEICSGLFVYAGEWLTDGEPVDHCNYRLERFVSPEIGDMEWRSRPFAWRFRFHLDNSGSKSVFWQMGVEGDEDRFKTDNVFLKLYSHLWARNKATNPYHASLKL